jgi:hypothetical protein
MPRWLQALGCHGAQARRRLDALRAGAWSCAGVAGALLGALLGQARRRLDALRAGAWGAAGALLAGCAAGETLP